MVSRTVLCVLFNWLEDAACCWLDVLVAIILKASVLGKRPKNRNHPTPCFCFYQFKGRFIKRQAQGHPERLMRVIFFSPTLPTTGKPCWIEATVCKNLKKCHASSLKVKRPITTLLSGSNPGTPSFLPGQSSLTSPEESQNEKRVKKSQFP